MLVLLMYLYVHDTGIGVSIYEYEAQEVHLHPSKTEYKRSLRASESGSTSWLQIETTWGTDPSMYYMYSLIAADRVGLSGSLRTQAKPNSEV